MIRKPISSPFRVLLGIASFFLLVSSYTYVSNRAYERNPTQMTIPGWTKGQQIRALEKAIASAEPEDRPSLEQKLERVQNGDYKSILKGCRKIFGLEDDESLLAKDAGVSLKRFALGMLLGSIMAFLVGIAMGCFTPVEAFLRPPVAFLASIPPTAMIVVYMLLFGLRLKMFVAVIGMGIFPTLAITIYQAVKNDVSDSAIDKAYTLGASHFEVIWEVIIPQILPRIIDAVRLQIGPAMIFLMAVEYALGSEGVGYRLRNVRKGSYYNVIFIYLILLGIFGMFMDWLLRLLRRWSCPWFEGVES